MGTMLHASVWDVTENEAATILRRVRAAVSMVDSLMSNYRPDSDVSRINAAAGNGKWIEVSEQTAEVLRASLDYARRTGGAFDPTVGPVVDVWGFYREQGAMPTAASLDSARALVGWALVQTASPARVRLPRAGMRLDFGAIAKGYAVDLALAEAARAGGERVMIDLGGNIGVLGESPEGDAWPLGLRHPRRPDAVFAMIEIETGAVATSGDYERYFVHDGVRYAHIVDPRTGWPVQGVASVSVLAPSGIDSDALSTSLFVLGPVAGCSLIADLPDVAAVWVVPEEGAREWRAVVGGPAAHRLGVDGGAELCGADRR